MNIDDINHLEDIFTKNINRVSSLIETYYVLNKDEKEKIVVTDTDTLRAAVVFLHAALEDVMRGLAVIFWVKENNPSTLAKIPLPSCNPSHHNLKFTLGDLCKYTGQTVNELIETSVRQYIYHKLTINDLGQLKTEIQNLNFEDSYNFIQNLDSGQTALTAFFERRHKIVHHADRNNNSGKAKKIRPPTVKKWKKIINEIVEKLFEEAKNKIEP